MVRPIAAVLAALSLAFIACGRTATDTRRVHEKKERAVQEYLLTGAQETAWKDLKARFVKESFGPCLKKRGVTVSCAGCTAVFIRAEIAIDKKGRFAGYKRLQGRYCGDTMPAGVEECLMEFFRDVEYPPELRGLTVEAMLGLAYKC